jgi:Cu2+-exporting ATPase
LINRALTGEAQPAEKEVGDIVFASTIVVSGNIQVHVEKNGYETTFYKINQLLNHTANFKSQIQLRGEELANKAALPFIGMSAIATAVLGSSAGLVIMSSNFGNRFRVLAPLGTLSYLKNAAQKGILIKDGRSIEQLNKVDTVLFDKTGTLTKEIPEVSRVLLCADYDRDELLTYAAAAERKVSHPIAKAIVQKAHQQNLKLPDIDDSKYQVGYGIIVYLQSKVIYVGSSRFMLTEGFTIPKIIETAIDTSYNEGNSLIFVAIDRQVVGAIELRATIRPEVKSLVQTLRQRGIKHIAIVSGDHKVPTQKLTEALGMDSYFHDVLPSDKSNIVEQLQAEGKVVCFIGDGMNDTIAMKKANVSISLTGASAIAIDVAEVILMDGTLNNLIEVFDISKNLNQHLQNSFRITLVPTTISMTGALLFQMNFMTAFTIKNVIFLIGVGHAMLPVF